MTSFYHPIAGAPNFTLAELCKSETAYSKGIYNMPDSTGIANLTYLAQKVLQPIRDHFAEPIIISSGYRSPALNKCIGGSPTSFHAHGCAADWDFANHSRHTLLDAFEYIYSNLPFTELILEEFPGGWIHVAIARGRENEKQLKYKPRGGVVKRASYGEILKAVS